MAQHAARSFHGNLGLTGTLGALDLGARWSLWASQFVFLPFGVRDLETLYS
jgi:hypothetical protein